MLSDLPVDRVSFAYKPAVKLMIARLLQSGWDLRSACDHALAFGDLVVAEIAAVRQSPRSTDADTRWHGDQRRSTARHGHCTGKR
jgi:hypothetical protein